MQRRRHHLNRRRLGLSATVLLLPLLAVAGCGAQPGDNGTSSFSAPTSPSGSSSTGTATDSTTTTGPTAGGSMSTSAPASPSTQPAGLPCSAPDMLISLEDVEGGADAQAITRQLVITNPGPECTLSGFPVLTYQAGEGEIIGAPAAHVGEPAAEFTLGSGGKATAPVREQEAGKYGPDCQPTEARLLAVALRDGGETTYVKREKTACASTDLQLMEVGPYQQ